MDSNSQYQAVVSSVKRKIGYYRTMMAASIREWDKRYYRNLIFHEMLKLNYWKMYYINPANYDEDWDREVPEPEQKQFTLEELDQFDGSGEGLHMWR